MSPPAHPRREHTRSHAHANKHTHVQVRTRTHARIAALLCAARHIRQLLVGLPNEHEERCRLRPHPRLNLWQPSRRRGRHAAAAAGTAGAAAHWERHAEAARRQCLVGVVQQRGLAVRAAHVLLAAGSRQLQQCVVVGRLLPRGRRVRLCPLRRNRGTVGRRHARRARQLATARIAAAKQRRKHLLGSFVAAHRRQQRRHAGVRAHVRGVERARTCAVCKRFCHVAEALHTDACHSEQHGFEHGRQRGRGFAH
eukprot:355627-Chlamydomonas_euryale.AAC.24